MGDLKLCSSKLGSVSISWKEGMFNNDGSLRTSEWEEVCRNHANLGADFTREMEWLTNSKDRKIAAFKYENGAYNYNKINVKHYEELGRMREIAEGKNLNFIWSLHYKKVEKYSPWYAMRWWDKRSWLYVKKDIDALIDIAGIKYFECCNEPFKNQGEGLIRIYKYLVYDRKIPYRNVMPGFYFIKGSEPWETFHKWQKKQGDKENMMIKKNSLSVRHNLDQDVYEDVIRDKLHNRRMFLSYDGIKNPRPSEELIENRLTYFLNNINKGVMNNVKNNEWIIEVLNNRDCGGYDTPCRGLAKAFKNRFKKWPENWGKFPKIEPKPEPEPKPDPEEPKPEPKEVKMKNWLDFKNYWKQGKTALSTWFNMLWKPKYHKLMFAIHFIVALLVFFLIAKIIK